MTPGSSPGGSWRTHGRGNRGVDGPWPRHDQPQRHAAQLGISGVCLCDHPVTDFERSTEQCDRCGKMIMPSGERLERIRRRQRNPQADAILWRPVVRHT